MARNSRRSSQPDDFEERTRVILAAALKEFSKVGYDAASINSIAAAAGISDGLIYKHFESKDKPEGEAVVGAIEQALK